MSIYRRMELYETCFSSPFLCRETSICKPIKNPCLIPFSPSFIEEPELGFALDLLNPSPFDLPLQCVLPPASLPFDVFENTIDLIRIEKTPFSSTFKRFQERTETDFCLRSLCDRVSALELAFDRVLKPKSNDRDRKYSLKAEIKGAEKDGIDRKYKWTADIKAGKKDVGTSLGPDKSYTWTAEIKGKGKNAPISQTYTFKTSTAPAGGKAEHGKKDESKKKSSGEKRVVEIDDADPDVLAVKEVIAKRRAAAAGCSKGKKKELSPQDAAMIIQVNFRAHLVHRSQTLRCLRDLAVAKARLREINALFTNFSYRRRIASDAEERQRFSEKIIVLLLTVDAIEGPDHTVRAARRSMVEKLEAMLDVVDPQPPGKLGSLKRRRFDLPENGNVPKEMALGVAEVVQMLEQEDNGSTAFEACL